jgi:dihydroorotate dehydrogenase
MSPVNTMSLYREIAKPLLFLRDPEEAHLSVLRMLALWQRWPVGARLAQALTHVTDPRLHVRALGLDFQMPVGLAAGLDKHAEAAHAWGWLGFGHAELGTITPRPQPGNPHPRLFRLPADEALINRMGFNSLGATQVAENLFATRPFAIPIGANVGKNKDTPNEAAVDDYLAAIEQLRGLCDWFTLNVSSPNTPDLRKLQEPSAMRALVEQSVRAAGNTPVLVKVAPDFVDDELEQTVDAVLEGGAAGVIATNTTLRRPDLREAVTAQQAGGLSGAPLKDVATRTIRRVYARTRGRVPVIGVGGIATADDAWEKLLAGADLLQLYSALIFHGPGIVEQIHLGLLEIMAREGVHALHEVVGQGEPL